MTKTYKPSTPEQQQIEAALAKHGDALKAAEALQLPIRRVLAVWARMEKINRMDDDDPKPLRPRAEPEPCGTDAAYKRHTRKREPIDGRCRVAHNEAEAERRAANVVPIRPVTQEELASADEPYYTTVEARILAGVSYREIDFWTRTGRLRPVGDVHSSSWQRRRYSESEVDVARAGKRLLDAGFGIDAALKLARQLVESGVPIRLARGLVVIDPAGVAG